MGLFPFLTRLLRVPIHESTHIRFVDMMSTLLRSEIGGKVKLLFLVLIAFLLGINALNVLGSYVARDFMTAIENKNLGGFVGYAGLWIGVFALSTVVAVWYRYSEERLGLIWRHWLTERAVLRYLDNRTYFRLHEAGELPNPDQRISEDIRVLTATTLSFFLMLLNATFTVIAFSGVMWTISPLLFAVTIAYAILGSAMTIWLGRPLIRLNYDQLDKEAYFRARLLHVNENAEPIALLRREGRLRNRLRLRLAELVENFQRMIEVNRNLNYFTTGYNYLIQIIPALVVAPLFIAGKADFGIISQSAIAFAHLIGAFSLIVTQFQSISTYTAVIARLVALRDAIEIPRPQGTHAVTFCDDCGEVRFEALTLRSPRSGRILVDALDLGIPDGTNVLFRMASESAKTALFRATADLWEHSDGHITRPDHERLLFLPERPYLPPGTLREVLLRSGQEQHVADAHILDTLHALHLDAALTRAGGLDHEHNWSELLSLAEQQLLAFSRVLLARPEFVFLDHPSRALSELQVEALLRFLRQQGITYLTLSDGDEHSHLYELSVDIADDGSWRVRSREEALRAGE